MSHIAGPPRLARALLRRALPADARNEVDGDLHELYVERRATSGALAARFWYWRETISFMARFTLDRVTHPIRALFSRDSLPSALDLKLGARLLAKSPGLAIVGGLGMAVAVALGAGSYTVINSYFYPELPLRDGDRIVAIGKFDTQRRFENSRVLYDFLAWRRELHSIVDLGAFRTVQRNLVSETGASEPITLAEMSASGFRVASVPALRGRTLVDDDEKPDAPPVIVIGYDAWHTRFGGDPAIIGRTMRVGRDVRTIVGVMPESFGFPVNHQYWIPLQLDPRVAVTPGSGPDLDVFGRLAPNATKQSAQAELTLVGKRLAAGEKEDLAKQQSRVTAYTDIFVHAEAENEVKTYGVLRFLIGLLLVIVATNVAVLVYARTVTRTEEIAVRTALGATRARIVGQLFAEALVLSLISAMVGLGIAAIGLRIFDNALSDYYAGHPPFWIHSGLSAGTILYALTLAFVAALIIGALPALRATGSQLRAAIGSLGSGTKARLGATWTGLIVAQIAITVAILPMAINKSHQTIRMALQAAGFPTGEYLSTDFSVDRDADVVDAHADSMAADSAKAIIKAFTARMEVEPGVAGVTVSSWLPWQSSGGTMEAEGSREPAQSIRASHVDDRYFDVFGMRVLAGRKFTIADGALARNERPVIVNRSYATLLLGTGDPIGRRVRYRNYNGEPGPWNTIVGVVDDFEQPGTPAVGMIYHLVMPGEENDARMTVRLRGVTPEAFIPRMRSVANSINPMLQLSSTASLAATYADYAKSGGQLALVILLVTGSVILLAAAGIHAMMAFTVSQRRREIGIRTALGAPGRRIVGALLGRASRQLAVGVGVGLFVALVGDRLSGGELMDGAGIVVVPTTAAFMLVVGFFAAAGPVRRGLRVEPTEALRAE